MIPWAGDEKVRFGKDLTAFLTVLYAIQSFLLIVIIQIVPACCVL